MDPLPLLFSTSPLTSTTMLYIGLSIGFGMAFTALLYMLSYVLNHPPLGALAKEELATLILSIVLVCAWIFFSNTLSQLACIIAFGSCNFANNAYAPPTHITIAYTALEILFLKLKSIYIGLYLYEVLVGFLSTVYVPLGTFNPLVALLPISFPPLVGLTLLSNAHTVLVEAIGMVMVAIIAKQHLLNFAMYAIPTIFLPMGLVLRAFPFYRTTGSSIIAICIVAYFVYPLTVILSNYIIFDLYKPVDFVYAPSAIGFCQAQGTSDAPTALSEKAEKIYEFRKEWEATITQTQQKEESSFLTKFSDFWEGLGGLLLGALEAGWVILKFMFGVFGEFTVSIINIVKSVIIGAGGNYGVITGLYYFIVEEVATVSQFVIVVLVTSVFEIIITITMYRNISQIIGGEMEIVGLSKLV